MRINSQQLSTGKKMNRTTLLKFLGSSVSSSAPIRQFGFLVPAVWKERRGKRVTVLFNDGECGEVVSLQNI